MPSSLCVVSALVCALTLVLSGAAASPAPRHFDDVSGDLPRESVTAVAVSPVDPEVWFAGTDGFLFRSEDGGVTWRPILAFPRGNADDGSGSDAALLENGARAATDADGFSRSTDDPADSTNDGTDPADDGSTGADGTEDRFGTSSGFDDVNGANGRASRVRDLTIDDLPDGLTSSAPVQVAPARTGAGVRAIAFVPGSPAVFYVATPRGLYRTVSGGSSFSRLELPAATAGNDVRDIAVDPRRPSRLYLATAAGFLISRDGGGVFEQATGRTARAPALCIAIGDAETNVVLVGTETGLLRSTDGGESFLEMLLRGAPPFVPILALAYQQEGQTTFAGTPDGLYVGERGAALLERYEGVGHSPVQALSPHPAQRRAAAIGTTSDGLAFTTDAGLTVESREQVPAREVQQVARLPGDPDALLAATNEGLFISRPGSGVSVPESGWRVLRKRWDAEPTLYETTTAALHYSGVGLNAWRDYPERAGRAAWLPWVFANVAISQGIESVRARVVLPGSDQPDVDQPANPGVVGDALVVVAPREASAATAFVLFNWDLDRLVLNPQTLQSNRNLPRVFEAEQAIVDRVRDLYGARRRLMTEVFAGAGKRAARDPLVEAQRALRLEELTAALDAATGGAFSEAQMAPP